MNINTAESTLNTGFLEGCPRLPLLVQADGSADLEAHREALTELVGRHLHTTGGLLFRGFKVGSVERFEEFARWFQDELLTYDFGSTPRSNIGGKVYTSTEYPPSQSIPLHNEMSYTRQWPLKIWFYSIKVAEKGGQTPIADSREIYERVSERTRQRFQSKGVMYVRNYRPGMDVPWQKVFNTEDKSEVEQFCRKAGIDYEWRNDDELRTRQVCQGVSQHPSTGEPVWFNQAHLFHISNLEARFREALLSIYAEDELPRNALYGDGSPIEDETLAEIRRVMDESTVQFDWQPEDLLMLDNMLVAHSRRPFEGSRRVAVAMAEAYSEHP